ncbi:MAG: response regulator transcription factor [Deltaproteobacteria bacterium]|nr:response regulator transcription factor [Deltaproteobacteria bacterium]MBW2394880.1 response regulator transcription factor [Deltaproteobacteria bacterium]
MLRILYVEDDPTAREYIHKGLAERGYTVDVASDGTEGLEKALRGPFDLLILDVMLPGSSGFDLLREVREREIDTPALFLSARGEVADRIEGLNLGADDYLVKPFAFAELVARIQAVARRSLAEPDSGQLTIADLVLDLRRHAVERSGHAIELTPKEFSLLEYLMRNESHAVSRGMITEKVWGYGFDSYSNLIDVHINHLRKKLDQDFEPKLIHTVKGVGYVLEVRGASEA